MGAVLIGLCDVCVVDGSGFVCWFLVSVGWLCDANVVTVLGKSFITCCVSHLSLHLVFYLVRTDQQAGTGRH